tara:strand:- start:133 stop:294 length:162 start_codon:yes stop_codon:yes gene_type:complete
MIFSVRSKIRDVITNPKKAVEERSIFFINYIFLKPKKFSKKQQLALNLKVIFF